MNGIRHIRLPRPVTILLQWLLLVVLYSAFAHRFWFDFGPDFVSYNGIARQYAGGNWADAINTWWSPLYSWMLAIEQPVFKDPLLANKILQLLAATAGWWVGRRLLIFHAGSNKPGATEIIATATIPFWVYWGLRSDTPDLVTAVLLLQCFYNVLRLRRDYKRSTAMATGVMSGLAYLAKAYNFYFIAAFGMLMLVVMLIQPAHVAAQMEPQSRNGTKQPLRLRALVAKKWLTVALPFLCISLIWMLVMYQKSGQWQVSSIGLHQPCTDTSVSKRKLHPEVYDCAGLQWHSGSRTSDWEQPQRFPMMSMQEYLTANKTSLAENWLRNAGYFLRDFSSRWLWLLLAVLLLICRSEITRWWWLYGIWYGIYVSGYCLFHLEARFFIMPGAMVMLTTGWLLLTAIQKWDIPYIWPLALAATVIIYCRWPIKNLIQFDPLTLPAAVHHSWTHHGRPDYSGKNLAAELYLYDQGLYWSFYSGARFYGALPQPINDSIKAEMRQLQIKKVLYQRVDGDYTVVPPR